MAYYKVIYKQRVIDVLSELRYVRYQLKHKHLLLCDFEDAEGILSSDSLTAYHTYEVPNKFPVDIFPTVSLEEITEIEYNRMVHLQGMTPEQIIDDYTAQLIEMGVIR